MPDERRARAATEDRDYYNRDYYDYYNGLGPYTRERWLPFFRQVAAGIVADAHPRTAIEYGCAKGFLVEALRERGVEAYGIDFSPHAIAEVHEPLRPYCRVGDVREPSAERYDVAICMEVLEHLDPHDAPTAIRTLAAAADVVYFTSNPDEDFPEATHVNVQPAAYWEDIFARAGMARDRVAEPHFIAGWALKFKRKPATVVVPVAADAKHARWCIEQLYRHTDPALFHLALADTGVDAATQRILTETVEAHPNATLLPGAADGDAVASALDATRTAAVVLLDPRTLVTAGWLERLLAPLAADPAIGLVCPLSNAGGAGCVELPDGYGFADAAELIAARGLRRYPTAHAVGGACALVRRDVLDAAEAAGGAGWRLADGLDGIVVDCLAAARGLGLRAALADDCYVYRGGAAARDGGPRPGAGDDGLGYLRDAGTATLLAPPDLVYDAVYYLPPTAAGVGGMISVAEIVNRLILLGQRATVATVGPWQIDCECLFRPLCYASEGEVLARPPATKALVATGHQTVDLVARVCAATGSAAAYFIQDYEGYFDHGANMEAVAATYARIPHRITVSRWVQGLLRERHDADSEVIPLGVAVDEFAPRGAPVARLQEARAAGRFLVFAMLRGDDRRGAPDLVAAARRLNERRPEVTFVFAGRYVAPEARLGGFPLPDLPNVIGVGLLDRAGMARHLASCDAALDASLYQGFGMLGVEALAAGVPAILSRTGGALEYAVDGENCLLVEPGDVDGICDAIVRLRDDPALAARLAERGRVTARDYDWSGIAARHARFLAPLQAEAAGGVYRRFAGAYRAPRQVPAPPVASPAARAIYRGARRRKHAYAAEPTTLAFGGYRVEGVAFALYAEPAPGLMPFYHCAGKRGRHFYTADPDEARRAGYRPADVLGYVAEAERAGTRPLHRFFRRRGGDHLYGLDPEEGRKAGYRHEGIVGFVPEAPTAPPRPDEGESPADG